MASITKFLPTRLNPFKRTPEPTYQSDAGSDSALPAKKEPDVDESLKAVDSNGETVEEAENASPGNLSLEEGMCSSTTYHRAQRLDLDIQMQLEVLDVILVYSVVHCLCEKIPHPRPSLRTLTSCWISPASAVSLEPVSSPHLPPFLAP